ncbi:MAG TPA: acetylornithine transaminase [Acidobacteriaceae bacterium]|jgi:acetylornithine/succinyldiaminopimelate/putrescine aminotransferase
MSAFRQNAEAQEILALDSSRMLPVYNRFPVVMDRGEGVYLFDTSGNRYLDLTAGLGVNALGHAHPRMAAAMADQAGRVVHLSPQYVSRYSGALAERLCQLSGMKGVFYSTGGAEAVEGALKLVFAHTRANYSHPKQGIVALRSSYHGRSYASVSVTGQEKYRTEFSTGLPDVTFVDRNDLAQLRAAVSEATAAILLEPVLGEGGVHEIETGYMAETRRLADQFGALLIFDEIQCGLGRTGTWFAHTPSGVKPDMLILGKPLGGGLPFSALLVTEALFDGFGMGRHGSTLGGTPLACRLGLEFLQVVEDEDLLVRVVDTGAYMKQCLREIAAENPVVTDVRGRGLILGMELTVPARPIADAALEEGFLTNAIQGTVLRFLPPYLLERQHVDVAAELLHRLLKTESQRAAAMREDRVAVSA